MRKLKIHTRTIRNEEMDLLLKAAQSKVIPQHEEKLLLEEIRQGTAELISRLVGSCEVMIISVARGHLNEGLSVDEMISIGRDAMTKLAQQELFSNRRERFFRFGAWVVEQRILNELSYRK